MDTQRFRVLSPHQRALVAISVLLDGREAAVYLENDSAAGVALSKAAKDLAALPPELRMPYVGSALRAALRDMGKQSRYNLNG